MIDGGLICDLILADLTGDTYYFSTQLFFFFLNYSPSVTFSSCLLSFNLFSKLFFLFTLSLDHSVSSTPSFIILRLVIFSLSCSMLKQVLFLFSNYLWSPAFLSFSLSYFSPPSPTLPFFSLPVLFFLLHAFLFFTYFLIYFIFPLVTSLISSS